MPEMHVEECPHCGGPIYVCEWCKFETSQQSEADDHEC